MQDRAQTTDPATFEIIKNSLYKIAEEMRVVLAKTAYSPLLKSAGDYSCGVFDARGAMVAQGPDLPIHLGSMPDAVRAVVAAFAGAARGRTAVRARAALGRGQGRRLHGRGDGVFGAADARDARRAAGWRRQVRVFLRW